MGAYPPQSYGGGGGGGPGADTRGRTIVVAASNSIDPTLAPVAYRCDGVNDQVEINAAIVALGGVGGTVILLEGQYNITASINLTSNTTLMGEGAGTLLRVPNGHNINLDVIVGNQVSYVIVADLKIDGNRAAQGAGAMNGIYFSTVTYSMVANCWVDNFNRSAGAGGNSIYLLSSSNNTIMGNICRDSEYIGIYLATSSYNIITGNISNGHIFDGIDLVGSSSNTITSNSCEGTGYGISIASASLDNTVTGNTCSDDLVGIWCDSNNNTITGNTCAANHYEGISLIGASGNTATGNTCVDNSHAGINLEESSDRNTITGNTCNGNNYGIFIMSSSSDNTITGNTCDLNLYNGIDLDESNNNTITGNTCQGNGDNGIYLVACKNNTISSNTVIGNSQNFDDSADGIHLESDSDYNNVQCNTVRHAGGAKQHQYGIFCGAATCNGNLVINNDLYLAGKTLDYRDTGTGTIYHNNRLTAGWVP